MTAAKRTATFVVLAFIIGVTIYLSFDKLFSENLPNYAVNISAAFLGAVITIIITAVLLNAQSLSELGKEKSLGVFNAKLALYSEFLVFVNSITKDGNIDPDEMVELRGWALKMSLISGADASSTIGHFIDQTINIQGFRWSTLDDSQQKKWHEWHNRTFGVEPDIDEYDNDSFFSVGRIIMELKMDLGEENVSSVDEAAMNSVVINSIMDTA